MDTSYMTDSSSCQVKGCLYMLWDKFILCSNFIFLSFLGMVMYDNEFETMENKIRTKDKVEPQHV